MLIDLSDDYPDLYEKAGEVLQKGLYNNWSLEDIHAKIFSSIMGLGYFEILSEYRLHLIENFPVIGVVFIPAEDNHLPSVIRQEDNNEHSDQDYLF